MSRTVISNDEAQFFHENGYLIVRGVVQGEEFRRLRKVLDELTEYGSAEVRNHPDFMYGDGHKTGRKVLKRVEYVIDKYSECKVLLGHPFILRSVEKLMGKDLIPTWDSMVLKLPGEGIIVPWHRDSGTECVGDKPIFNVDFYIDAADEDTCVWIIPGSHKWSEEKAMEFVNRKGFSKEGAVPAIMEPGDVLFHNILVLHGSPENSSGKLRRVVYYEFRTAHVEEQFGPHVPAYIPLKQKVLLKCIEHRTSADHIPKDEEPFAYTPPPPYNEISLASGEELATYRYAHADYWRK
jgi:ectoine hydroxylase-related dioxygenase (phytanoyl-CoA dioxygenase family)